MACRCSFIRSLRFTVISPGAPRLTFLVSRRSDMEIVSSWTNLKTYDLGVTDAELIHRIIDDRLCRLYCLRMQDQIRK